MLFRSELRFYGVLWGAFGVLTLQAGLDLERHAARVPWLMLVFFGGGAARALSWIQLGPPRPFFVLLMSIELVVPVWVVGVLRATRSR